MILALLRRIGASTVYILVTLVVATVFSSVPVLAQEHFDIKETMFPMYDPDSEACQDPATANPGGNTVYMVGDSWLVGMMQSDPGIESTLRNRGMTLLKANAVSGRSINGAGGSNGSTPQSGMDALTADSNLIASAGKIVVVLGTNSDSYTTSIPRFMEQLSSSPAQVYWVNTAANASNIVGSASSANEAIIANSTSASEKGYTIIDWFSAAFPGGDPTNIDPNADSPLMGSDKIHPQSGAGYSALVNLVTDTISGSSGGGTIQATDSSSRSSLPEIAQQRLSTVEPRVEQNKAAYEEAATQTNLPWQVIAALHYRETGNSRTNPASNDDGVFQIESLSFPPGQENTDAELTQQAVTAGNFLKDIASSVYQVELTPTSSIEDLKLAFLSYNRGSLYKNVPPSEGGPWPPELSPYVMNLYDSNYLGPDGDGMLFPAGTSGNRSGTTDGRRWGETVSGKNNPAGVITFLAYFGLSAPGANQGGCGTASTLNTGALLWPVVNGTSPVGTLTACWSDHRNRTVSGGSYYHSGIDVSAPEGTTVLSAQGGSVVFAGQHSDYGNLVIVMHDGGLWTHYGHLSAIEPGIVLNKRVSAGEKIGSVGNTGVSTGNHLHLNLYNKWPFGPLPEGAAMSNGQNTINPLTHGLSVPQGVSDEAGCKNWPNGGRVDNVAI